MDSIREQSCEEIIWSMMEEVKGSADNYVRRDFTGFALQQINDF
jgi:hypothetical protein